MAKIDHYPKVFKKKRNFKNFIKRLFDLTIGGGLLLILSPILIICAVILRLFSKGPIFFKQVRTGKDNQPFIIWKFRTMEDTPNQRSHHNYDWAYGVPDEFIFKTPTTQKITKIGRVYRKLSIDELPQLFNVLKGEMSLIGPRPEIPEITKLYNAEQKVRLRVKPGITGYAQVHGRSDINHGTKIKLDLYYVENQSLKLDLSILCKTVFQVSVGKGAE